LIDCKSCKQRYRADKLINESLKNGVKVSEATPLKQLKEIISSNHIKCPNCGKET
jgi:glycyl-tRNA synthetase